MFAAQRRPAQAGAVIDDLRRMAERTGDAELVAPVPAWCGLVAYREGQFELAARLHEQSADHRTSALGRMSARVNAASAADAQTRIARMVYHGATSLEPGDVVVHEKLPGQSEYLELDKFCGAAAKWCSDQGDGCQYAEVTFSHPGP